MSKTRWFYTYRSTFKGLLFVFALLIIIAQVLYTQNIVSSLRKDQQELVQTYAKLYQLVAESDESASFSFLLDNVILQITIPVILTSPDGQPNYHTIEGIDEKNPPFSSETINKLEAMIKTMDEEIEALIFAAADWAEEQPYPEPEETLEDVYYVEGQSSKWDQLKQELRDEQNV